MRKVGILFSLIAFGFIGGCGDDSPTKSSNEDLVEDYFPMKMNSLWVYQGSDIEGNTGEVIVTISSQSNREEIEVFNFSLSGDTDFSIGNGLWPFDEQKYFVNQEGKLINIIPEDGEEVEFIIIYNPLQKGTTWDVTGCSVCNFEIISVDEKLTVPVGDLKDVLHIQFFIPGDQENHFYYARNIGLVKFTARYMDSFEEENSQPQGDLNPDEIFVLKEFVQ